LRRVRRLLTPLNCLSRGRHRAPHPLPSKATKTLATKTMALVWTRRMLEQKTTAERLESRCSAVPPQVLLSQALARSLRRSVWRPAERRQPSQSARSSPELE